MMDYELRWVVQKVLDACRDDVYVDPVAELTEALLEFVEEIIRRTKEA